MIMMDTLLQSKVQLATLVSSMLDRRGLKSQPSGENRPSAPMVMDLVPAGSDGTLDVLIGCLGAMNVLQARTVDLAAEVEEHLAESAREQRQLRTEIEALRQRSLSPPPPPPPEPRSHADAARVEALHQRLQAVETGVGHIVRHMIASCVVADPDFDGKAEPAGEAQIMGTQARLTAATTAAAQHRARIACLRDALVTTGADEVKRPLILVRRA